MLVSGTITCERCGASAFEHAIQGAQMCCVECQRGQEICSACRRKGCIACGAEILNPWDWAERQGGIILF
jgi:hypothetical protein